MSNHTGAVVDNPTEVDYIFDSLYIEKTYNFTLPEWTDKVFPQPMKTLRDLSFQLTTWTHELKRLRSGPLIQDMLDRAKKIANARNSTNSVEVTEPKIISTLPNFLFNETCIFSFRL